MCDLTKDCVLSKYQSTFLTVDAFKLNMSPVATTALVAMLLNLSVWAIVLDLSLSLSLSLARSRSRSLSVSHCLLCSEHVVMSLFVPQHGTVLLFITGAGSCQQESATSLYDIFTTFKIKPKYIFTGSLHEVFVWIPLSVTYNSPDNFLFSDSLYSLYYFSMYFKCGGVYSFINNSWWFITKRQHIHTNTKTFSCVFLSLCITFPFHHEHLDGQ